MDERVPPARPRPFFEHEIRVGWADCDPANIVYTGRIPNFALDAIDAWWEEELGRGVYQMRRDLGIGPPFVHLDLDFRHPLTPDHRLICRVVPVRMGETSLTFRVTGRQGGRLCFEGSFTCVIVEASRFAKCPPPAQMRARIEALIAAAAAADVAT